ncbi:hypothetical protein EVH55_25765 [Salmonella enterica subsp. enterica serovar Benin]|nr:hypothetical protein [Salmonella enterica subsp. enterica serovar Benin]
MSRKHIAFIGDSIYSNKIKKYSAIHRNEWYLATMILTLTQDTLAVIVTLNPIQKLLCLHPDKSEKIMVFLVSTIKG